MKLSAFKKILRELEALSFILPTGEKVPSHFHVTEVGKIDKHFIDCGGMIRNESIVNFQLYYAGDYDHRLGAQKLGSIIELSEKHLGLTDAEIEVEYQVETIGKYGLEFINGEFHLITKQTDCLAKEKCGIPEDTELEAEECCAPGSGCC